MSAALKRITVFFLLFSILISDAVPAAELSSEMEEAGEEIFAEAEDPVLSSPEDYTVVLEYDRVEYDGEEKKPKVMSVSKDGNDLTEGEEYTVSYPIQTDYINPGEKNVVIFIQSAGKTIEKSFTILAVFRDAEITLQQDTYTYSGAACKPDITRVVLNNTNLVLNQDYASLTYSNNINAGTATVTIYGLGDFAGKTASKTFTINPKSIEDAEAQVPGNITYTGSPLKPAVTVKDGSRVLTEGTDYDIEFADNINAGTASYTVRGNGNYSGSKAGSFSIAAENINNTAVSLDQTVLQAGVTTKPAIEVFYHNIKLAEEQDYSLNWPEDSGEVGEYQVTIDGKGNFTGSKPVNYMRTVTPTALGACSFTITPDTFVYDGSPKKPEVSEVRLKINGKELVLTKGTDYTISYRNNVNAGTGSVIIEGKGNCTGLKAMPFTIEPLKMTEDNSAISFTGEPYVLKTADAVEPTYSVAVNGKTLTKQTDFSEVITGNGDVGIATLRVKGTGNYTGELSKEFAVFPRIVDFGMKESYKMNIELKQGTYTYDGQLKKPEVEKVTAEIRKEDGSLLGSLEIPSSQYRVSYANNMNAGGPNANVRSTTKAMPTVIISGISGSIGKAEMYFDIMPISIEGLNPVWTSWDKNKDRSGTAMEFVIGSVGGEVSDDVDPAPELSCEIAGKTVNLVRGDYSVTPRLSIGRPDFDFTVLYQKAGEEPVEVIEEPGSYTVILEGCGNFSGTNRRASITARTLEQDVNYALLSDAEIKVGKTTYGLNKFQRPKVTVTIHFAGEKKQKLKEGTHYTVSWINNRSYLNRNRRRAAVVISAIPGAKYLKYPLAGSVKKEFQITKQKITKFKVSGFKENMEYDPWWKNVSDDGMVQENLKVKDKSGQELVEGVDYIVSYKKNKKAGKASMEIWALSNNYIGSIKKKSFKIKKKKLNDTEKAALIPVVKSDNKTTFIHGEDYRVTASLPSDGKGAEPAVEQIMDLSPLLNQMELLDSDLDLLSEGYCMLEPNKDYTVTYKNNKRTGSAYALKNPPTIIIRGINYDFTKTIHFTIE